ncbi:hypothetical protein RvY_13518-2 [Ramazzottius varieornatus]|uniref:BTB domain-containing protein n=1 Tax=Ramazzottius varieornatus TaxID=947166 RepID=A0A1D1VWN3_RAMVA|nr:hypothetical protein RvY_13518-2 [Ramazzottius varieornatus]
MFKVQLQQRIYNPNRRTSEAGPRKPFQVRKVVCPSKPPSKNSTEDSEYPVESPVTINVSGQRFETRISTLERFPDSLLGNADRRAKYYDQVRNEYFFERNRRYFSAILEFYQSNGIMRRPENVMVHHLVSEILFFGLGQDVLERFLHDEDMLFLKKPVPKNPLQRQLWDMFEYPASSRWAKMVAAVNVVLVIMAVINTCVQTLPEYRESDPLQCSPNNRSSEYAIEGVTSEGMTGFFAVEILCNSWFLVDLVIRLTATPTRRTFFCQIMNIIDVLSIVPFVFDLGLYLSGTV